jgi:hypothetical protein
MEWGRLQSHIQHDQARAVDPEKSKPTSIAQGCGVCTVVKYTNAQGNLAGQLMSTKIAGIQAVRRQVELHRSHHVHAACTEIG